MSRLNSHTESSLKCASAIGAALRGAGFRPSRYHADPIVGENRPFADEANGVHYFDNLAVLKTASIPALLFEAGVIVNRDEELRMRDPAVRSRSSKQSLRRSGAACDCRMQSHDECGMRNDEKRQRRAIWVQSGHHSSFINHHSAG